MSVAQDSDKFYYYNGDKISLKVNRNRLVVYLNQVKDTAFLKNYTVHRKTYNKSQTNRVVEIETTKESYDDIISSLKKEEIVKTVEIIVGDSLPIAVSNLFYVKLKASKDIVLLKKLASKTRTKIVRGVSNMPKWYVLEVNKKSISDCIGVSNVFSEANVSPVQKG